MPPTTLAGRVIDQKKAPMAGVKVLYRGKAVAESGREGFFSATVDERGRRVALTFSRPGHVSSTRIFDPKATGPRLVVLWRVAYEVGFDPAKAFDATLGGSRIRIPADALVDQRGARPKGAVLRFTSLDVRDRFQRQAVPGDFSGELEGKSVRLNAYAAFHLDVSDSKGRALELRRGAKVKLDVALPEGSPRGGPTVLRLFDFPLAGKVWRHLFPPLFTVIPSTLTYSGYVERLSDVSGGTYYSLDDPQETVCVTLRVVSKWGGAGMPYFSVVAYGSQYNSYGTTDADGFVCLLVQRNSPFDATASGVLGGHPALGGAPTRMSPNFVSDATACGNADTCPLLGNIVIDTIVGMDPQ